MDGLAGRATSSFRALFRRPDFESGASAMSVALETRWADS